jgi:dTDP-glucose 4,6-dehydratase
MNNLKVLNIDLIKINFDQIVRKKALLKKYNFKKCDIRNSKKLNIIISTFKPDYIVNFAAETHVDRSIVDAESFISTNIIGVYNILNFLKKSKRPIRFIQVSTDEVFGSLKRNENKFHENSPYKPKNPYSASKAAADHLVKSFVNTYKLDCIVTNCSNNYGPRQYPEKLIPLVILSCLAKKTIPIYGEGRNIRDWIHVKDHCRGIYLAIKNGKTGESYLLGGNKEISNINIVEKICKIMNKEVDKKFNYKSLIKFVKDRPGHDFRYAINSKKSYKYLKFNKLTNFNDSLNDTINHYIKYHKYYVNLMKRDNWFSKNKSS